MKTHHLLTVIAIIIAMFVASCKPKYASTDEFFAKNGPPLQTFLIKGTADTTLVTPQGTTIKIPASTFIDAEGSPLTGAIKIEFKDLYKKSDMVLSRMPTTTLDEKPLKSGGMFFIKALSNDQPVDMAPGAKIVVEQPLGDERPDSLMEAMVQVQQEKNGWTTSPIDQVQATATSYIFSLYQFSSPISGGTWCNSDNPYFWNGPKTLLTLDPQDDPMVYNPDMFLVFKDVTTMIHVYNDGTNFPYRYAPLGYECTAVAVGTKDGELYSSFTTINIDTDSLVIPFTLSLTTTNNFKAELNALNN